MTVPVVTVALGAPARLSHSGSRPAPASAAAANAATTCPAVLCARDTRTPGRPPSVRSAAARLRGTPNTGAAAPARSGHTGFRLTPPWVWAERPRQPTGGTDSVSGPVRPVAATARLAPYRREARRRSPGGRRQSQGCSVHRMSISCGQTGDRHDAWTPQRVPLSVRAGPSGCGRALASVRPCRRVSWVPADAVAHPADGVLTVGQ